jgi:hypothetical protein
MRPIFRGFCINWFGIGPLHYILSPSDFGFEFTEMLVIKKRLTDSASRWLSDLASQGVTNSLTRRVGESLTLRLGESRSGWSLTRRVPAIECLKENSPLRWVGESSTPRIAESESWRLPVSASRGIANSPTQWGLQCMSACANKVLANTEHAVKIFGVCWAHLKSKMAIIRTKLKKSETILFSSP